MGAVLYARGETAAALEAARKAVARNPWDMIVRAGYGMRLLWSGDARQAMPLLLEAEEFGPAPPHYLHFALFIGAYMRGDAGAVARFAQKLSGDTYVYGVAARAVAAVHAGRADRARREVSKLIRLRPEWRTNARLWLERYGAPAEVAARMASDLDAAGIRTHN
jgi:predicted Zn-dependent protease